MEFLKLYLTCIKPNELNEATKKDMLDDVLFVKLWKEFKKVPDDLKKDTFDKMFKIAQLAQGEKCDDDVFEENSSGEDSDSGDSGYKINVRSLCKRL